MRQFAHCHKMLCCQHGVVQQGKSQPKPLESMKITKRCEHPYWHWLRLEVDTEWPRLGALTRELKQLGNREGAKMIQKRKKRENVNPYLGRPIRRGPSGRIIFRKFRHFVYRMQVERKVEWLKSRSLVNTVSIVFRLWPARRRYLHDWRQIQKIVMEFAAVSPADLVTSEMIRRDSYLADFGGYISDLSSGLHEGKRVYAAVFPPNLSPCRALMTWIAVEMILSPGLRFRCLALNSTQANRWMAVARKSIRKMDQVKAANSHYLELANGSTLLMAPVQVKTKGDCADVCVLMEVAFIGPDEIKRWSESTPFCVICTQRSPITPTHPRQPSLALQQLQHA